MSSLAAKMLYGSLSETEYVDAGSRYFAAGDYEEAVQCFSGAIVRNPSDPLYFINRALALLKLNRHVQVAGDCESALCLEPKHQLAHHMLGLALCELGLLDEGIEHFQRVLILAQGHENPLEVRMTSEALRRWRKRRQETRIKEDHELQRYLSGLIQAEGHKLAEQAAAASEAGNAEILAKLAQAEGDLNLHSAQLKSLFGRVDEQRSNREVPDYLCCKISLEILREPVVTPSGITYERTVIEEHLRCVGEFDPVTRAPLKEDQLVFNFAIKDAVDAFLAENEWALDL